MARRLLPVLLLPVRMVPRLLLPSWRSWRKPVRLLLELWRRVCLRPKDYPAKKTHTHVWFQFEPIFGIA